MENISTTTAREREEDETVMSNFIDNEISIAEAGVLLDGLNKEAADAEKRGDYDKADNDWVAFGEKLDDIKKSLPITDLVSLAQNRISEADGYRKNIGLSILALSEVIDYYKENNMQNELINLFKSYIPNEKAVLSIDDRCPEMYNFIMSTEGLLGIDFDEQWVGKPQIDKLVRCCGVPDMQETLVYKKFVGTPEDNI